MRRFGVRWPHALVGLVVAAVVAVAYRGAADAPAGQYVLVNGVVLDNKTQLTWQRAVPSTAYTWSQAMSYCSQNTGGLPGGPWRLPNVKELQTLVDESQATAPMLDPTWFPAVTGTPSWAFWTSTPVAGLTGRVWAVDFGLYGGDAHPYGEGRTASVRCVR